MYASNPHSYTHLILALGIVRKPTVWVLNFITSRYPGIHDIGLPTITGFSAQIQRGKETAPGNRSGSVLGSGYFNFGTYARTRASLSNLIIRSRASTRVVVRQDPGRCRSIYKLTSLLHVSRMILRINDTRQCPGAKSP